MKPRAWLTAAIAGSLFGAGASAMIGLTFWNKAAINEKVTSVAHSLRPIDRDVVTELTEPAVANNPNGPTILKFVKGQRAEVSHFHSLWSSALQQQGEHLRADAQAWGFVSALLFIIVFALIRVRHAL